jgi:cytochrome c
MSSFEWNKIIASVLTAMIVAMVTGILASAIVRPKHLQNPAYVPPGAEAGAHAAAPAGGAQPAAAAVEPIQQYMAKADPKRGESVAKVCLQCHSFEKGGANKIGPNLYGVTEENIAARQGYQFSPALSAKKDEKWTPENMNVWLHNPQSFAKGTKMSFAGVPKAQDRADLIAYLESLK